MTSQLKGVLFDFDDTLIDWSGVTLSWRDIEAQRLSRVHVYLSDELAGFSIRLDHLVDAYWKRTRDAWSQARVSLRAPNMPETLLTTLRELGVDNEFLDVPAILKAYDWNVVPGTKVFPDVPPALEMLRDHGVKTGIVTNASQPMWMRDTELRAHSLIEYFPDCRISGADAGYLKPHPRIFRMALAKMNTEAAETVFIGDNPVADVGGAQAVGMHAVRRFNPGARLNGNLSKPHKMLRSLAELPAILDSWYPEWRGRGH